MNLFEKYMNYVRKELISYKLGYTVKENDTDIKIITRLFNAKQRYIPKQKYIIKESQEIKESFKRLNKQYQEAFNEIKMMFSNAEEVRPYLSTRIKKTDYYDKLLLDWNIHHLHLNKKNSVTDYWVDRSDYLLLFIIEANTVYFVDIEKHKENNIFEQQKYLKVIYNNWSNILEPYKKNCEIASYTELTDSGIKKLREAGINTPFIIDNKAYMGFGDGISGAGTNFLHQGKAMRIKKYLTRIDEYCKLNEQKICHKIYQETNIKLETLTLDLFYDNDELRVIETKSNCLI